MMVAAQVDVWSARIPMRRPFDHAGKRRSESESVLLRVEAGGVVGWGEAAPRSYVTNETVQTVTGCLTGSVVTDILKGLDLNEFDRCVAQLTCLDLPGLLAQGGSRAFAAAACIETALVDLVCRGHNRPMLDALPRHDGPLRTSLGTPLGPRPIPFAVVIDLSRDPSEALRALGESRAKLTHVKLKATHDPQECLAQVEAVRGLLPEHVELSVDANGAWDETEAHAAAADLAAFGVCWVEEPLPPRSWRGLAGLREAGLPVLLDESVLDEHDLAQALAADALDGINVRVSKCGGPLRSAGLALRASASGLIVKVGCQVGELGPLWAAGRVLATAIGFCRAVEAGRQDEWFDPGLTVPAYCVDRDNHLFSALPGPGLGLVPSRELLDACEADGLRQRRAG